MKIPGGDPRLDISPAAPAHVLAASPLLRLITVLTALLGMILLVGGLYLAFGGSLANTKFNLFGNEFASTSVGVSMAFIGTVLVVVTFRRVLRSVDRLAALPDEGGRGQPAFRGLPAKEPSTAAVRSIWPAERSLEALKRRLDRMSETNARIFKAIAGADQYGIYADELSQASRVPRDELVYRGKEMVSEGLIEMLDLTDLNFRLHEDVINLLGDKAAQFITAYIKVP
jgi:hypothetical protein